MGHRLTSGCTSPRAFTLVDTFTGLARAVNLAFDRFVMLLKNTLIIVFVFTWAAPLAAQRHRVMGGRRVIAICSLAAEDQKLVGFEIKFLVSKDTQVINYREVDYIAWAINFGSAKDTIALKGFSGLNVGNGEVSREHIAASRRFTRRYWTHNKQGGVDGRGTLKNGRFWRTFGMFGETVWYHNVPADAAAYFDRILDTACFLN